MKIGVQKDSGSFAWLIVGIVLLLFSNGKWIIPIAAWAGPVFMVRFLRTQNVLQGLLITYLSLTILFIIQWRGLIPIPGRYYYFAAMGFGLVYIFPPYLADRIISSRVNGFVSTLAFPLVWTLTEFFYTSISPYGSWGSIAYSQSNNLPLLQISSVTGIYGISFLVAWFATIVNWVWEQRLEWRSIRIGLLSYLCIMIFVLLLGGARLVFFPPSGETVRVASITGCITDSNRSFTRALREKKGDSNHPIHLKLQDLYNDLFRLSKQEAQAGAKIIFWSEANAPGFKEGEESLIIRGREFARQNKVYLLMSLFTFAGDKDENKLITINPQGEIISTYFKSRPVPGDSDIAGDGMIPVLSTFFGKMASVICFDMDFPQLIRQVGQADADILLAPSSDWVDIEPLHARMAVFRAIENGVTVVRQAHEGLSLAVDYHGNILGAMDHFSTGERVLVSHIPVKGIKTIYSRFGDVFSWLCLFIFALIIAKILFQKKWKSKRQISGSV